jgi:tripartite ATP-independent transporter DctM subunit
MDQLAVALVLLVGLFALLGSSLWVALSLLGVGFIAMLLFTSAPIGSVMATTVWGASASWSLAALPLFIWMGEILFRTRLAEDMFYGLAPWLTHLPGRLMHTNIIGSGIFAAVSGSSAATAATIGKMTIPELSKRGYDERMMLGSLAGAGTLGLLIPPSIIMIVYGVSAEVSIARLFIAGVLPGILLVLLFMGYVMLWAWRHPEGAPPEAIIHATLRERLYAARRLIPVVLLILAVIGSLYIGLATPTEAAALGVLGALLLALVTGALSWRSFVESLLAATRTSCMISFILAGAAFLTVAMAYTGLPRALAAWIGSLQLSPHMLLAALTLFFIVLGCFLDGISVVVLTTSVILPMVQAAGIDLLWFGIFIVLVVEMAQITPPVGFNLFVIQGLTGRDLFFIARAAFPFFVLLLVAVALITIFPEIVTFLPRQMSASA